MKHGILTRSCLGFAAAVGLFAAGPASPAMASTTACSAPVPSLTQPFLAWGDANQYNLAAGQSPDNFNGSGWTLTGGASITTTTLADGSTGQVLNLPSGSKAISPTVCMNQSAASMHTMIRNVVGSEGVFVYVSYTGASGFKNVGQVHGQQANWTASDQVNASSGTTGWQQAQFEFVSGGTTSDFQLYNFYVNPSPDPCASVALSQPFASLGDQGYYALPGGESKDNFSGTGWTLSGGAKILTSTLQDGSTGPVLDLPSGAQAVSPPVCVNNAYPVARTMVRNVRGSEGVGFYVGYDGTNTWTNPQNTGSVNGSGTGWTLSTPVNVQPGPSSSWELAEFTLIGRGTTSEFQIYNFYVDPRMAS